jgi:hypothetical protein
MMYAQFARKKNAMWLFLAACVSTNVCVYNSHGNVHTGIRVGHMMQHAPLAGSMAALARLSGDWHACLRKAQRGLGVHCMQLADTSSAMQWRDPFSARTHRLLGVRFATRRGNRASARRCSYLSVLLCRRCEESGDERSVARAARSAGTTMLPDARGAERPPSTLCTE